MIQRMTLHIETALVLVKACVDGTKEKQQEDVEAHLGGAVLGSSLCIAELAALLSVGFGLLSVWSLRESLHVWN